MELELFHKASVKPPNALFLFVKIIVNVLWDLEHFFLNIFPKAPSSDARKINLYFMFLLYNDDKYLLMSLKSFSLVIIFEL